MATEQASTVTLPLTFGAAGRYVWGAAGATVLGALTAGFVMPHAHVPGVILWAMTALYLLLAVLMLSLRVHLSADGLAQHWLITASKVPWKRIARLERTARFYTLLDQDNKELVLLRFLPAAAQQTIARVRTRKSSAAPACAPSPRRPPRPSSNTGSAKSRA